ncbi:T7SS effector LXG polymorphic toxin [Bacillus thuringiensis]|uniref:T7SS effector LXG polymorphic toxin n=1 Tax=Bacillus TaxID=1386 RepID=UPI00089F1960|nr:MULTISPECIES: T7SS effector LXG polymorphic toxin [Bacillus]HDR8065052.1 cytoplasmic protein [Bacillus cereus]MED3352553.1 T7SS effector LXG polymorphic toxin [Bacillus thuringiensis]MEE3958137.1 T7SS effector LXG polymorphic toxin [Bacillus thuringiensis]MRB11930.1 cytoplasmic protein [Bacillus thuringiensis]OTX06999.1 cytoplasmic protein [Bacillus thuringiensis serovar fukuokaensis]
MSLNMYLGEVQNQTQSMNAICNATIQSMEQAIQSIDAFAVDTVLQGQTYSSAKAYLVQTFRPLAQGIICLCEELIRQNEAFPSEFQAKVASTDVIEQEIREQIRGINQSIASIEAIEVLTPMPGVGAIVTVLGAMRKKLEEKLEHLYEFNHSSSNNYSTALQLAASITAGLAEVQSGKGFSPVSGTFSTQVLNMNWVSSIQGIIEETARKNDQSIKDIETNNIIEEKSPVRNAWDDAADGIVSTFETAKKMWEAIQRGSGKAVGDEIESAIALSNMDIGTFINVAYALFHLDETAKNMWHAFSNKIKRDMIEGDAESRTELTTYGLTQIATTILGDKALNKVGHIAKGAKVSSGVSTFANAVKLAKELKPTLEMLQSFKREASYALSSVGGTIVTKIPQGELIEAYYKFAKSKDGGKGTGETLSKQKSIPDFVKKQWEAGNRFNKENRPRYPYNEVELEAKEINGKKYVVDSYIPGEEIVSRKFTQLAEVKEKTALSYLSEFTKKYSSGSEISSGKFNPNALKGGRLDGELILEIPVQTKPVPQKIIEEANEKGIIIRDINGKVYN